MASTRHQPLICDWMTPAWHGAASGPAETPSGPGGNYSSGQRGWSGGGRVTGRQADTWHVTRVTRAPAPPLISYQHTVRQQLYGHYGDLELSNEWYQQLLSFVWGLWWWKLSLIINSALLRRESWMVSWYPSECNYWIAIKPPHSNMSPAAARHRPAGHSADSIREMTQRWSTAAVTAATTTPLSLLRTPTEITRCNT